MGFNEGIILSAMICRRELLKVGFMLRIVVGFLIGFCCLMIFFAAMSLMGHL